MRVRFLNHEMSSVHAAAFLLGAAGLLSRLAGVVRDRLLASHFGAGRELDIYYAAFQIPDFMSVIFLLGAGSAAILPVFQEYLGRDRIKASRLISQVSTLFLLGALVFVGLAFFLAPWLVYIIVPGFSSADISLTVTLMRIMLLSPILFGLSSIFSAVIQSFERFISYALAPILYNLGIIVGILWFVPAWGVIGLAGGVVLGALLHVAIQYRSLVSLGFSPRLVWGPIDAGVKKIIALSAPRVLSLSFTQLTVVALIGLASLLASGSISIFQFSQNLYFVPVGIFGVSYSVALFPRLSSAYIERNGQRFFHEFFLGLRSILFWIIPSVALFFVLRMEIVRVVLGSRAFSWEDTQLTAACLGLLAFAMVAASLMPHLVKSFYALENTRVPLAVDMGGSVITVGLAFMFTKLISHSASFRSMLTALLHVSHVPHPEVLGIALGFSLGLAANVLLLYIVLVPFAGSVFGKREPARPNGHSGGRFPALPLLKIVAASLIAGVAAYAVRAVFPGVTPYDPVILILMRALFAGVAGLIAYFGMLLLLKSEDMEMVRASMHKRFLRLGMLPKSWNNDHLR
ncbi:MAG: murein biosynthesis integral membrane protein MurJ [Candidatus Sungbacteria bacterium]|nr:murein biosynthesis integral membrane protein MurJ [Candidatus Sungbacteria bacterium]